MAPKLIIEKMLSNDLFSQWLDVKVILIKPGECKLEILISENMTNGFKIAHGGISYSIADSCLAFAANAKGYIALTKESSIKHIKQVKKGDQLNAHAFELENNNQYLVKITNQNNEIVADFRGIVHYTTTKWNT
jgi:acyl-CoA thioesterase